MRKINVLELADRAQFSRFHLSVLLWCGLVIIFDGYDLAVAGIALPLIMKSMGVGAASAGVMVSAALVGMMLGAIIFGSIADQIGRRRAIGISVVLFSVGTVATGFTNDPIVFGAVRFIAGLGIGGVLPNVVAEMTEFSPKRIRTTMVTFMFSGYAVGGMLAAATGKAIMETYGWQTLFFIAAIPLFLLPFALKALPESMPFLIRKRRVDELRTIASCLDSNFRSLPADQFVATSSGTPQSAGMRSLFGEGRGFSTLMIWTVFFMCLFMVYSLSSWLAKLMVSAGYTLGSSLTFVLVLNFGAVLGAIGGGWLADRLHIKYVLMAFFLIAAASIGMRGFKTPTELRFLLVGIAGATTIGTQLLAYAYVGQFYPASSRGTGVGWASGVGRTGAIIAPIVIGALVEMNLKLEHNFYAIAIPGLIAFVAMALVNHGRYASAAEPAFSQDEARQAPASSDFRLIE